MDERSRRIIVDWVDQILLSFTVAKKDIANQQ
jgi:hypothetical protein